MEEKHHEFSPSRLDRIKLCPGSWKMEKGLPQEAPSPYAEEGRMLHERVATGNLEGLTDEQKSAVESCIEFRDKLRAEYESVYKWGKADVLSEFHVVVHDGQDVITEGTADTIIYKDGLKKAVCCDYKFGFTPVKEVSYNLQLAAYAAGVMEDFDVDEVECHVFQPRIFAHSSYTFRKREAIIENIKAIIAAAKADAMILNPTEDSCRYCRARLQCPAFRTIFQGRDADDLKRLDTPDKIAEEYAKTRLAVAWAKEVEEMLKAVIERDGKCGKYQFKVSEGSRQVKDINAAYERVKELLTFGEFNGVCSVSVGKLETLVAAKIRAQTEATGGKITLADAKKAACALYEDLISRGTPSKTVVETE